MKFWKNCQCYDKDSKKAFNEADLIEKIATDIAYAIKGREFDYRKNSKIRFMFYYGLELGVFINNQIDTYEKSMEIIRALRFFFWSENEYIPQVTSVSEIADNALVNFCRKNKSKIQKRVKKNLLAE